MAPLGLLAVVLLIGQAWLAAAQDTPPVLASPFPEAPEPQIQAWISTPAPCAADEPRNTAVVPESPSERMPGRTFAARGAAGAVRPAPAPCAFRLNWYRRFARGPQDGLLSPKDKAWLAARNLFDPFNLITIGGEAAIAVASDSHSDYGPGLPGWGRDLGVSFTEDMTGEFFGTFLIPSIAHQNPHYHRLREAGIPRRTIHAITQVVRTESDQGKGMPNYANLAGFALDDVVANLYVPGRKTDAQATADRYGISLATAPIGNLLNEFLPDVAEHIHVQIFVIQRIINHVATSNSPTQ